ncbi:hypothetical protein [Pedobacter faecalis]|uniref:hypothetical protein n=1 Tax=Pedobacter faecalis TaxID=3041495 RepID=UPI00254EEEEC|nr:hypothetical protein [Pedobacter sp. ELA7]
MKMPFRISGLVSVALFMMTAVSALAQEAFVLKGVIKDQESQGRVSGAQIVNQRTRATVSSDALGLFQIKAVAGDTLLVIKSGFTDFTAAVNSDKTDMIINLSRNQMLKEVTIVGQSRKSELEDVKRDHKRNGSFYEGKPPALSFLFTPLTAIYELLGKTPKNARRFGRYYTNEMEETHVDGLFNESIIQSNTTLRGKDLEQYMFFYRPSYERAKSWTMYDAIKYIKDSSKQYLDSPTKLDSLPRLKPDTSIRLNR